MNQGKIREFRHINCLLCFRISLEKFRSRLRRSHTIDTSNREKNQGKSGENIRDFILSGDWSPWNRKLTIFFIIDVSKSFLLILQVSQWETWKQNPRTEQSHRSIINRERVSQHSFHCDFFECRSYINRNNEYFIIRLLIFTVHIVIYLTKRIGSYLQLMVYSLIFDNLSSPRQLYTNYFSHFFINSQLSEELELVKKDNRRAQGELDERRVDYDKFKALQSHSTHQQMLLHQLRNRLEEHEWVEMGIWIIRGRE